MAAPPVSLSISAMVKAMTWRDLTLIGGEARRCGIGGV